MPFLGNSLPPASDLTNSGFPLTRWSLIARMKDGETRKDALGQIYQLYLPPLYGFLRRRGCNPEDAKDILQDFFVNLLENEGLERAEEGKGRLRNYLLGCLRHMIVNRRVRARAQKRGGGAFVMPLDWEGLETRFADHATSEADADKLYDREWALALVDQAYQRLEGEYRDQDKAEVFQGLKPYLCENQPRYKDLAKQLGKTESHLAVELHRLRKRFKALLRREIASTVEREEDVDEELRWLGDVLSQ